LGFIFYLTVSIAALYSYDMISVQNNGGLPAWLTSRNGLITVLIVAVCLAVLITHWPALSAQALSFDDNRYFVENYLVRSPGWESTRRFLTEVFEPSTVGGYYQPLTMISLMLDYALGGQTDSLRPFHQTSLVLHIANTALIIVLLYQLFGSVWIAAAVGLLFGVHPLTVEPIPWVGERKTLLAAFFTLWSLVLYVRFARRGNWKTYLGCVVMYMLALMSKPTSTPLPAVMLLMDFWPLKRLKWQAVLEKLPLFVIGGCSAVITYISQSVTASVIMPESYGIMRVPQVICHNIIFYLYKMVWPANLSSHYAFPAPLGFSTPMVMIGVIGTCVLIPLLVVSLRWTRAAITGWLIFFMMIFPTMQMLQFSDVIASDKFVYLPSMGILMILAAFLSWICYADGIRRHTVINVVAAIAVLTLAGAESFATRQYLACWQDTVSLYTQMVKVTPRAISPLNNLGAALAERGDVNEAMECFTKVLKIKPDNVDAHINLGKTYADQGKYDEAMSYYEKAMRLTPKDADAYRHIGVMLTMQGRYDEAIAIYRKGIELKVENSVMLRIGLGTLLAKQGKIDEAIYELQTAVEIRPESAAFNNLGALLVSKGRIDKAMEYHKKAIGLDPKNAEAYYNLGNILLSQNKLKQAISEYEKAVRINPKYTKAHINLAVALTRENRLDEAIEYAAKAVKTEPNNVDAQYNLAVSLGQRGRIDEAITHFAEAVKIEPNNVDAHYNLAVSLGQRGRIDEAIEHFAEAVKIEPNNIDAHYGLAHALVFKGQLQEAVDEYRQVLRLEPNDIDTRCILGDVLVRLGRLREAAIEYLEVLKINPQHPEAQQGLKNISSGQQPGQTTK